MSRFVSRLSLQLPHAQKMEDDGGGGHLRHQHIPPPSERFLGISRFQSSSAPAPPLELSEHDIFNTPSGSSSPSSSHSGSSPNPIRGVNNNIRGHHGILAALNDQNQKVRSGSDSRPVFNHKASASASLSSSSSTSPASSASMIIPKRPPPPPSAAPSERTRFQPRSAPMNIPKMAMRGMELEDIASEGEEENGGVMLPPHELIDSRRSPMLACSVLEGAGRTLKGRDLRQVRNAIWRRTGFID